MKYLSILIFLLLFSMNLHSMVGGQRICKTIIVDDDNTNEPWDGTIDHPFNNIQDAIDYASDGDTVFVCDGLYCENLVINKSIYIRGENCKTTVIDGEGRDDVVTILSEGVTFSGFTIQNSSYNLSRGLWWKAGIRILGSNTIVEDTVIQNNLLGIFAKQVEDLTIRNNYFYNDSITIYPYDGENSTHPSLERKHFIHCIENNLVNGKPMAYLIDQCDFVISSDVGQVILVNCTNVSLKNTSISHADFPVIFVFCNGCRIENSSFFDNDGECTLLDSDGNTICFNMFHHNFHGFLLDYNSEENMITHNIFSKNRFCGVICEFLSNENMIIQNNFLDNNRSNAFLINAYKNKWNENYWSDWIGLRYPFFQYFPKVIRGSVFDSYQQLPSLFNVDLNPSLNPYEI